MRAMTDRTHMVLHVAAVGKLHFINISHMFHQNSEYESKYCTYTDVEKAKEIYMRTLINLASTLLCAIYASLVLLFSIVCDTISMRIDTGLYIYISVKV